jgi:hypothetical protein
MASARCLFPAIVSNRWSIYTYEHNHDDELLYSLAPRARKSKQPRAQCETTPYFGSIGWRIDVNLSSVRCDMSSLIIPRLNDLRTFRNICTLVKLYVWIIIINEYWYTIYSRGGINNISFLVVQLLKLILKHNCDSSSDSSNDSDSGSGSGRPNSSSSSTDWRVLHVTYHVTYQRYL